MGTFKHLASQNRFWNKEFSIYAHDICLGTAVVYIIEPKIQAGQMVP